MSREMSSGQNLQSFPHSTTALITHLEDEIQFLDGADCFPKAQESGVWEYMQGFHVLLSGETPEMLTSYHCAVIQLTHSSEQES